MRVFSRGLQLLALAALVTLFAAADGNAVDKSYLRWVRSRPKIDSIVVTGNTHFSDGTVKSACTPV